MACGLLWHMAYGLLRPTTAYFSLLRPTTAYYGLPRPTAYYGLWPDMVYGLLWRMAYHGHEWLLRDGLDNGGQAMMVGPWWLGHEVYSTMGWTTVVKP